MLIAQISDSHISPPGELTCGVADTASALTRIVEALNRLTPRPDLVLHSGDVTHFGTRQEAEHAKAILSRLSMPLRIVPGNHDDRAVLADVFGPGVCPMADHGSIDHVVEAGVLRIIALDSVIAGAPDGRLVPAQIDWLRARLQDAPERPTLMMLHHPPLKLGVPETDETGFGGADSLADLVAQHGNIERILCGHVHLHITARWAGTLVVTAPSTAMELTLDLTQATESRFWLSQPAFLLHHRTEEGQLITHPIQLANKPGPFDF